jgi:hypothetical protein
MSPYDFTYDPMMDYKKPSRPMRTYYLGIPYPKSEGEAIRLIDELDRMLHRAEQNLPYEARAYGSATQFNVKCVLEKEKEVIKPLPYCPPLAKEKKLLLV